jgi:molybdenum cofactor cytidylyltransferase
MRYLAIPPAATLVDLPAQSLVCHDVRNPADRAQILVRKGAALTAADLMDLLQREVTELHVAVAEPDDVGENLAADRLAAAVAGPALSAGPAKFGQATLRAATRGMFRVDVAALARINSHADVLVLTAESDRPVDVGTTLGVVKCAPLLLPGSTLRAVEDDAAASGPMLDVEPFRVQRLALLMPTPRVRGRAFDRARTALGEAVEWYGSSIDVVLAPDATTGSQSRAYAAARDAGVDLILSAGGSATDPLDVVFEGLRQAGGEVGQIGIAAEPGTACWIGQLDGIPVLGLASCELFGQPGALDLLLPRLFSGEVLDRALVRDLAFGGLLLGPSRIAPYHAQTEHAG